MERLRKVGFELMGDSILKNWTKVLSEKEKIMQPLASDFADLFELYQNSIIRKLGDLGVLFIGLDT